MPKTYSPYKLKHETFNRFRGVANYDNHLTLPKEYVGESDNIVSFRVAEINQRLGQTDEEFDSEGPVHTGAITTAFYALCEGPNVHIDDLDSRLIKTPDIDFISPIFPWPINPAITVPTTEEIEGGFPDEVVTCEDIWDYDAQDGVISKTRPENAKLVIYDGQKFVGSIASCYELLREPIKCSDLWDAQASTVFTQKLENANLVIVNEYGNFVRQPHNCWEYLWSGETPVYQGGAGGGAPVCYLDSGSIDKSVLTFERQVYDVTDTETQTVTVSLAGVFTISNVTATTIGNPFEVSNVQKRSGNYTSTTIDVDVKVSGPAETAPIVAGKLTICFEVCGKELCIPVDLEVVTYLEKSTARIIFGKENETGGECTRCQFSVGDWNGGSANVFVGPWTGWPTTGTWLAKHSGYTYQARTSICSFAQKIIKPGWVGGSNLSLGEFVYEGRTGVVACNCPQDLYITFSTSSWPIYRIA